MKKTHLATIIQTSLLCTVLSASQIALAQQENENELTAAEAKEKAEAETENIVVTGSRIKRDSFSIATPLVSISRDAIEDSGIGSLSNILIDQIPSISENNSNTNSQSSVQNTGLSTVNLRNLGVDRTLTLIDGRRAVSNSYSGNYVSLSTLPSGIVDRVEIISGGASAIYGSDAVAGVVNIITQTSKEGLDIEVRGGESTDGGGREFTIDFDYGTSFNNDKGYLYFSADWNREFGLKFSDRDRAQIEASYDYNTTLLCNENNTVTGDQCMRDITQADWRERSDGTAGGVFEESGEGFYYTQNGLQTGFVEERDGIFSEQFVQLRVPDDTLALAFKVDYELSNDIQSNFHVQYSVNDSLNVKSPEDDFEGADVLTLDPVTGAPGEIRPGTISTDNPFAPPEIANNAGSSISWDRRFFEVGPVTTDNSRKTLRSWLGFNGTVFNGNWDWDVSLGYGKFQQRQNRLNELDIAKVGQALDSEFAEDGTTIQCSDPDARAAGCVPLNIFGINSITPEAADWIRANPTISTDISQINLLGYIAGDLFSLPAGPVATVFGVEYRKDTQKLRVNEAQQFGGVTFNVVPAFDGDLTVYEAFAEANFPLLRDAPFAKILSAEASLRLADYSFENVDLMSSYKLGLVWQISDEYLVRANYARAQRAPNITETLSPPRGDFDGFDDICADTTATSTDAGHDACRLEPGIAATIQADGIFEDENNGYSPNTGNPNLTEETADTYTLGLSLSPKFIDDFNLAIDFYDITVEDAIGQIGNEDILNNCYNSDTVGFGDDNSFCRDLRRDADGQLIEVLQREFNLNELRTRGYDIAAEYKYSTDDFGRFTFRADLTHVIEHSEVFEGNDGAETINNLGTLAQGIFEDAASASVSWRFEGLRMRWRTKYLGDVVDDHDRVDDYLEDFADNQVLLDAGDPDAIQNPEVPLYLFYGSYLRHDFSISYSFDYRKTDLRVFGGVRNVFNDKGAFVPNTGDNIARAEGNFSSRYGGGMGRYVYAGVKVEF